MHENNFILLIDQYNDDLLIALNFGRGHLTDFIKLENTAFAIHPRRPSSEFNFPDFELGCRVKRKWSIFLGKYLQNSKII